MSANIIVRVLHKEQEAEDEEEGVDFDFLHFDDDDDNDLEVPPFFAKAPEEQPSEWENPLRFEDAIARNKMQHISADPGIDLQVLKYVFVGEKFKRKITLTTFVTIE